MNSMDYKPNSNKYKKEQQQQAGAGNTERKKMEKVISGAAKTRKNDFRKIVSVVIAEDPKTVKDRLVADVVIPTIKKVVVDLVQDGISILMYGSAGARKSSSASPASKVSYRSFYDNGRSERPTNTYASGYSYDDIVLETRGDAEEVMDRLEESIKAYGMVSVADLYDLVGISGEFTDNKYGWYNLRGADIQRVSNGYLLKLPRAQALN